MKQVQFSIILVILFCLGILNVSGEEVTLETLKSWTIVTAPDAIESEKYAAEEFQAVFKLATGVSLEKTDKIPADTGYILIGQAEGIKTDDLGEEGLRIVISPNSLIITGGRPRGVLYGVYEFFEQYLDVQFLTTDHTYIPENIAEVKIPCQTYSYVPPFIFRWTYMAENNTDHKFATRMRTNTIQIEESKFGKICEYSLIGHSFHNLLPVKKYGKDHPEYFMYWNGARAVDFKDGWGAGPNPCYASQGALDLITKSVRASFKTNSPYNNISLGCVDSHAHCQCDECKKVNDLHGGTSGSHFAFINKVAKQLKDEYPDKFIGSLAYYHTRHAPTNMQMEDNVQIQLCSIECCTHHALDDPNCPKNVSFYKDMKDWGKICKNIMIWNYNVNFHRYDCPFPNLKSIGPNVRFFRDNNVKGVFMQSAGNSRNSSMSDLKNWVISQCLWKPGASSWDLALKFCKMRYAESAGPIIEWLTLLHNHVALSDVHYSCFPSVRRMNLNAEMGVKALRLFKEAMNLAKSDVVRRRVEKASICAYRLIIEASPYVKVGDAYKLVLPVGYENTLEEYKSLIKKYKTDRPSENGTFSDYIKKLEKRKVVTLENKIWKIELLPSWNAKVFNLLYKPLDLKLIKCRVGKKHVRYGWHERAIKGIESELRRDYVITYKVDSQDADSVTLSAAFGDGSILRRKIWLDKESPSKIYGKTEFTHNADKPKEYQFKVIPQFYYDDYDENSDYVSTLVLNRGKYVELMNLIGGKLGGKENVPLNDETKGRLVLFNNRDGFGLQNDYSNLYVQKPHKWWDYCTPRYITAIRKLEKGQSMSWEYSLTPIKENLAK